MERGKIRAKLIALAIIIMSALVSIGGVCAYFTVQQAVNNNMTILPVHKLTYKYYEVDTDGGVTKLDKEESLNVYKGTIIKLRRRY